MIRSSRCWAPATLLLAIGLAVAVWLARDTLLEGLLQNVLAHQTESALAHQVSLASLSLDSDSGLLTLEQLALSRIDDPLQQRNLTARQVELYVRVSGVLSPHVQVHQARVQDAEIVLEYIAPGVSNLHMLEQSFRNHAQQRQADGKSKLLEWDLERVEFQRVRFRLLDYGGRQLADVQIPRLTLDSLSSSKSAEDNMALALRQIQLSLLEQTLLGQVDGDYDLPGILHLVGRELPNSSLLTKVRLDRVKEVGRSLMDRLL